MRFCCGPPLHHPVFFLFFTHVELPAHLLVGDDECEVTSIAPEIRACAPRVGVEVTSFREWFIACCVALSGQRRLRGASLPLVPLVHGRGRAAASTVVYVPLQPAYYLRR